MSASSASSLLDFLKRSYPATVNQTVTEDEIPNLSHEIFPGASYTDNEKIETTQWLTASSRLAVLDEDEAKHAERLGALNIHLSTRTTLLGAKPSIADIALFFRLAPAVKTWTAEERTGEHGYHHIVRFIDFVQNAPLFGLSLKAEDKLDIEVDDVRFVHKPIDPKEEKERKKKEKAATAAGADTSIQKPLVIGTGKDQNTSKPTSSSNEPATATSSKNNSSKKEKKEKPPKAPKPSPETAPLSPSLIDLRVGHILQAVPHPNADSLYVSTIACGDPPSTPNTSVHDGQVVRTVCSGLNGLIPLAEMQKRKIVAVCNLKPVTMRGVKSAAMVLAASPRVVAPGEGEGGEQETPPNHHKEPVELVDVPEGAEAGERVYFEGWEGEPEPVLNPKKKVWESIQVGFTTTEALKVGFDPSAVHGLDGNGVVAPLRTKSGGICSVKSLRGATVR